MTKNEQIQLYKGSLNTIMKLGRKRQDVMAMKLPKVKAITQGELNITRRFIPPTQT
jgi:predicted component of type VI protein secretion system